MRCATSLYAYLVTDLSRYGTPAAENAADGEEGGTRILSKKEKEKLKKEKEKASYGLIWLKRA